MARRTVRRAPGLTGQAGRSRSADIPKLPRPSRAHGLASASSIEAEEAPTTRVGRWARKPLPRLVGPSYGSFSPYERPLATRTVDQRHPVPLRNVSE